MLVELTQAGANGLMEWTLEVHRACLALTPGLLGYLCGSFALITLPALFAMRKDDKPTDNLQVGKLTKQLA